MISFYASLYDPRTCLFILDVKTRLSSIESNPKKVVVVVVIIVVVVVFGVDPKT